MFDGEIFVGWKCNNDKEIVILIEDGCFVFYWFGGYIIIYE